MESDNYRTHSVEALPTNEDSTNGEGSSSGRNSTNYIATNGLTNGLHRHEDFNAMLPQLENRTLLRTTLSCEENDENPVGDEGERNNMETGSCPKYKSCRERLCNEMFDRDLPSGSGTSSHCVGVDDESQSGGVRKSRKRAADCRSERSNLEVEASSSDTSNDDYSLGSEDGCIYTYRGGEHLADLPSSFFSLDMGLPHDRQLSGHPAYGQRAAAPRAVPEAPAEIQRSRASSPDMDFLEMDFDPDPSCDADSGEASSPEEDIEASPASMLNVAANLPQAIPDAGSAINEVEAPSVVNSSELPVEVRALCCDLNASTCQPSTSGAAAAACSVPSPWCVAGSLVPHVNARGERILVRRTCFRWPLRPAVSHHTNSGDLVCDRGGGEGSISASLGEVAPAIDQINMSSTLYHCTMAKKLFVEKPNADFMEGADTSNLSESDETSLDADEERRGARVSEVSRCMVWSEREACERQVTQIGSSACGATAVINTLLALGVPIDTDKINNAVGTRQRANNAPVPRYLLSRAVAGCTAAGLVAGLQQGSGGVVSARFFPTFPERVVSLSHWLADWISLGAIPIATLNLQAGCDDTTEVPDAWHHQMIFGVSPRGVFLSNPVECVPESQLWPQLCSDSLLLVRSRDVLSRLTADTDLTPLMTVPDPRWDVYNVLGQVVNLVREARECSASSCGESGPRARHVRLPCAYRAGLTLAALTGSEAHRRLITAHQLPLYQPCDPNTLRRPLK